MLKTKTLNVMRAIVVTKFGDPDVLIEKHDVPCPIPEPNEALVKVGAVGVNPVETYIRSGKYGRLPELPYTPGNDMCGTVVSVGSNVRHLKEGDRVASFGNCRSGAYAEYCAVDEDCLVHLPNNFDVKKGAALGVPFFTAYKALFLKGNAKPTDTVLIHGGSGGVGIACCQFALSQGMNVIATAGTKEGIDFLESLGVSHVFNHKESEYIEKIKEKTKGQGVDIIVEMLSNVNLNNDLTLLAQGGKVLVVGCRGTVEINPRLMMTKESSVQGVGLFLTSKKEFVLMRKAIEAGIRNGWINPWVGSIYPLDQASKAHQDIIDNGAKGKMVLTL